MEKEFHDIYKFCEDNLKNLIPWEGYYYRRYLEFLSFYDLFPQKKFTNILELGCGIGYYSSFLSLLGDFVFATDIGEQDIKKHSFGLNKAQNLLDKLKIKNVELKQATAENLPFSDNTFDMVFSSFVLEHVVNREKAIKEIYRVLKPGGINFCVVPTSMERFYSLFNYYLYLFKRAIFYILKFLKINQQDNQENNKEINVKNIMKTSNQFTHFPFPPPHGEFPNYLSELYNWTFKKWERLITQNNEYELLSSSTTEINPLLIYSKFGLKCYSITRKLEISIGKDNIIKNFGINAVFITRKNR